MPNKNLTQVAIDIQDTESVGTAHATLFTSTNMKNLCIEPELSWDFEQIQRQIRRGTLTPVIPRTGARRMGFRTQMEFAGSVALALGPSFATWLRSCGMGKANVAQLTVTALTSILRHGTRYVDSNVTVTKEFTVMGNYGIGATEIFVARNEPLGVGVIDAATYTLKTGYTGGGQSSIVVSAEQGGSTSSYAGVAYFFVDQRSFRMTFDGTGLTTALAAGDVVRGVTSRAMARVLVGAATGAAQVVFVEPISGDFVGAETIEVLVPTPNADVGDLNATTTTAWAPWDDVPVTIGWARDVVRESLQSARGTWALRAEAGGIPLWTFDHKGVYNAESSSGLEDGGNVASIDTSDISVPPLFTGASIYVGDETTDFNEHDEEIPLCINVMEITANNQLEQIPCANNSTGFSAARVISRDPVMTLDPELAPEAFFAFMGKYRDGGHFRLRATIGQDLGNKLHVFAGGCAVRTPGNGDRSNLWTRNLTLSLTQGANPLGASELCLVYQVRQVA